MNYKYTFKQILHNLFIVPYDNFFKIKKSYVILSIIFTEQSFKDFRESLKNSNGNLILEMLNDKKQVRNKVHFKFLGYREI